MIDRSGFAIVAGLLCATSTHAAERTQAQLINFENCVIAAVVIEDLSYYDTLDESRLAKFFATCLSQAELTEADRAEAQPYFEEALDLARAFQESAFISGTEEPGRD